MDRSQNRFWSRFRKVPYEGVAYPLSFPPPPPPPPPALSSSSGTQRGSKSPPLLSLSLPPHSPSGET
eukprot:518447-Rhodomonas_salina.1